VDFGWEEIGKLFSYLIPVIIFILVNVFFRKQQEQKRRLTVVKSLLSEIDYNQKLMEALLLRWQTKKFKTGNWKRNRDKMDYIDQGLHATLAGAYEVAEGFNREIEAAKNHKSASYLAGMRVDRLREPLAESKHGLEEWLALNKGRKKPVEEGDATS
jgi:hypothetical protein